MKTYVSQSNMATGKCTYTLLIIQCLCNNFDTKDKQRERKQLKKQTHTHTHTCFNNHDEGLCAERQAQTKFKSDIPP